VCKIAHIERSSVPEAKDLIDGSGVARWANSLCHADPARCSTLSI
jgi:hypothetical protein